MDVTVGQLKDPDMLHNIFIKDQAFQFLQQVSFSQLLPILLQGLLLNGLNLIISG